MPKDEVKYSYYPDGSVRWEISYRNGQREGIAKGYYPDGSVRWEVPYHKGQIHGVERDYKPGERYPEK